MSIAGHEEAFVGEAHPEEEDAIGVVEFEDGRSTVIHRFVGCLARREGGVHSCKVRDHIQPDQTSQMEAVLWIEMGESNHQSDSRRSINDHVKDSTEVRRLPQRPCRISVQCIKQIGQPIVDQKGLVVRLNVDEGKNHEDQSDVSDDVGNEEIH